MIFKGLRMGKKFSNSPQCGWFSCQWTFLRGKAGGQSVDAWFWKKLLRQPDLTFKAMAITTAGPSSTLENQTRKIYLPSSRLTLNLQAHLHMHWIPEGFNKEAQKLSMRVKCKLELRWGCKCESLQIKYPTQMWPAVPSVTLRIHLKHSSFSPHSSTFGEKKEGRNCQLGDCPHLSLCLSLSAYTFSLSHFLHHFLSLLLPWSLRSSYILPPLWHLFMLRLFFVCTLSFRGYKI